MNFNHRDEGDTLWGSGGSGFVDADGESGGEAAWEPGPANPGAAADLFEHYAEAAPGVEAAPAPGVGKPPPPMSRDELDSLLE